MTRLFGIIGSPIAHSLSPIMHEAAFRAMRLDARYAAIEVRRRDLASILRALILCGVEGLNVTVPLKETVMPWLDRIDPEARAIGAVNTIVIRHRRTLGSNTDGIGFARALRALGWREHRARAVILGAGGASRAVAWELSRVAGSELVIANRHVERARALARWLAQRRPNIRVHAVSLSALSLEGAELLVNATTIGMRAADGPPISLRRLSPSTMVYDLISHHPTAFLRQARRRGCVASGGMSMLLYQGAESLRRWLHRTPPLTPMQDALLQAMRNAECGVRNPE